MQSGCKIWPRFQLDAFTYLILSADCEDITALSGCQRHLYIVLWRDLLKSAHLSAALLARVHDTEGAQGLQVKQLGTPRSWFKLLNASVWIGKMVLFGHALCCSISRCLWLVLQNVFKISQYHCVEDRAIFISTNIWHIMPNNKINLRHYLLFGYTGRYHRGLIRFSAILNVRVCRQVAFSVCLHHH